MPRIFRNKRDLVEPQIFAVLQEAGRKPLRLQDFDIAAEHVDGFGVLIDCKSKNGRLTETQEKIAAIFKDRFRAVKTPLEALEACGVQTNIQEQT